MIAVRKCRLEHRELAVSLWSRCSLTRPWNNPATDYDLALSNDTSAVLGGFLDDLIVASVMVGFDGHRGWIYYLAVDPAFRFQGYGSTMIREAEAWLRARNAPKLQFMVRDDNLPAVAFYEHLGFERQSVITLGRRLE